MRAVQLGAVLAGEGCVGQDTGLAAFHTVREFGPARAQLLGHLVPGFSDMRAVGQVEGLADRGGNDGVLAARDMCHGVAHPVNATALPGRLEYPRDGGPEAGMRIADHQPDRAEPPGFH